jgi:hypothetical protein
VTYEEVQAALDVDGREEVYHGQERKVQVVEHLEHPVREGL